MRYESPPGKGSRPGANGAAGVPWTSPGRCVSTVPPSSDTLSTSDPVSLGNLTTPCHADEYGLIDLACMRQLLDAEERAYVRGYAAGRESVYAEIDADVAQAARNAARSIDVMAARQRTAARWAR